MAAATNSENRAHGNQIYHEKQRRQFCLLHALNNLFQVSFHFSQNFFYTKFAKNTSIITSGEAFTRTELDSIANELTSIDPDKASSSSWNPVSIVWKPHHNAVTGNYDINVLFAALERKGKRVVWYDKRNGAALVDLKALTGIILNKAVARFGGLWKGRHWIALKEIDGIWFNLDSNLQLPLPFDEGEEHLRTFLDESLANGGEILLVFEAGPADPAAGQGSGELL